LFGAALIVTSIILSEGCTKESDDSDDDELIGNWKRVDDFEGLARSEAVSFTIADYGYVTTGASNSERFRDLWEYSTTLKYWTQKANLPGAVRNSAVAFSIGSKAYVGTGYDGVSRLNDFWEYDRATNTWTQKANFAGSARYDAIGFSVNGKGYIGCGFDGNYLKDFWEYDPATDQWSQKASVGGAKRSAAVSFVINNKAYVLGGNNNGEIQKDLWGYDATANSWSEKTKIYNYSDDSYDDEWGSISRQNGVAFVMGNYVYISNGDNSTNNATTWQYDANTDSWTQKTTFEATSRTGAVAFSLNNRGFVLTGRNGSLVMDNAYEFLPNDEQVDND
jgi:N-acetylneuraminic acid mutarotase